MNCESTLGKLSMSRRSMSSSPTKPKHESDVDEWENLSGSDDPPYPHVSSSPSSHRSRRRKVAKRNPALVVSSTAPSRQIQRSRKVPAEREPGPQWLRALTGLLFTFVLFVAEIVTNSFKLLKYPLTLLLSFYMLSLLVSRLYLAMTFPLTSTLNFLCELPGSSIFDLEFCKDRSVTFAKKPGRVDYPKLMEIETQSFEKLLDNSLASTDLIYDLKKAEMASTDLNTILLASDLQIKDHLSTAIRDFVEDARRSGRALQKLEAKIEGTVDHITAFNDYTMQSIGAASIERAPSLPIRVLRSALMIPTPQDNKIGELFDQVMSMLETHMERLLAEGQSALSLLDQLEERLTAIHLLVAQEDDKVSAAKRDLLAELWSILGGNQKRLAKYDKHIDILRSIDHSRQRALAHVVAAVTTVESTQANLEDLRERASSPGLLGTDIPLEAHVLSMKAGIERIALSRARVGRDKGEAFERLVHS